MKTLRLVVVALGLITTCSAQVVFSGTSSLSKTTAVSTGAAGGGGGFSASINLNSGTPGSATVNVGSTEQGSLSAPVDVFLTNTSGGVITMYANYYVALASWPAGKQNFVQYSGDAMARSYAPNDPSNTLLTDKATSAAQFTLNPGSSGHIYGYLVPTSASSSGTVYFNDGNGVLYGSLTINATGTTPSVSTVTTPTGMTSTGGGTVKSTVYPNTSGFATTTITSGNNLQTTIDAAACGTLINMTANNTWTGNFILRNKGCDAAHPIILISTNCNGTTGNCTTMPNKGSRATRATVTSMAKIQTGNTNSPLLMENAAGQYRLVGIEITQQSTSASGQQVLVVTVPSNGATITNSALYPHDIVFDRVWIHHPTPDNLEFATGVVDICGNDIAIIDSIISTDGAGNEVQGVSAACNLTHGVKLVNDEIVGSSENVFYGGADGYLQGAPPSQIEIQYSWIYKPATWNRTCSTIWTGSNPCGATVWDAGGSPVAPTSNSGTYSSGTTYSQGAVVFEPNNVCHYFVSQVNGNLGNPLSGNTSKWWCAYRQIKNLLEFKKGYYAYVGHNILDGCPAEAQDGSCLLLECANQSGADLKACVRDFTFQYNIIRNGVFGYNGVTSSYAYPTEAAQRISINNNLFYNMFSTKMGSSATQFINNIGPGATLTARTHNNIPGWYLYFEHNTFVGSTDPMNAIFAYDPGVVGPSFYNGAIRYNIFGKRGTNGLLLRGVEGDAQASTVFSGTALAKNIVIGGDSAAYSSTNFIRPFPATESAMGWVDPSNGDWRLCTGVGTPSGLCGAASPYHNAAGDGLDYGADVSTIQSSTACVISGVACNPLP